MFKNSGYVILLCYLISFHKSKGCTENKRIVGYEHKPVNLLFNINLGKTAIYKLFMNGTTVFNVAYDAEGHFKGIQTFSGVELIGNVTAGNLSIRIPSMNSTYERLFTLQKSNSMMPPTQCINLYMRARPNQPVLSGTVLDENGKIPSVEDKEVRITCTSTGGYPKPNMAWYKTSNQSTPLVDNSNMTEQDDRNYTLTYTFKPKRADDGKLFICQTSYDPPDPLYMNDEAVLYLSLKPSKPTLVITNPVNESQTPIEIATCESGGFRPDAVAVSWALDGNITAASFTSVPSSRETFSVNSRYQRSVGRKLNGKVLRCVVNHTTLDSPLETRSILNVQFRPHTATINGNTTYIEADKGNTIELTCTSDSSNPRSNVTWYHNQKPTISNSKVNYGVGQYNGTVSSQTFVFESVQRSSDGDDIYCTILNTVNQQDPVKSDTKKLDLKSERDMDGDEIYCTVHNNLDRQNPISSDVITLDLMFHPIATVSSEDEVVEGETITFRCNVNSKPESNSSMSHNGTALPPGTLVYPNVYEYNISAVNRNQAGTYRCLAHNGHLPNGDCQTNLTVNYAPDVTVSTTNVTVNDRSSDISCVPSGIPSTYTYLEWQHIWPGHGIVQHTTGLGIAPTLSLSRLTYEYTGIYRCTVSNGIQGSLNENAGQGTVFLEVETFPIIITHGTIRISASLNNATLIPIAFYSNVEVNTVECLRNNLTIDCSTSMADKDVELPVFGTPITTKGIVANIELTIQNMDQFGVYNVQITNAVGSSKMVIIDVIPEGPPASPSDVTIDEILSNVVTLSWMPGFHGGFNQTFILEYSRDGHVWLPDDHIERHGWKIEQRINGTINNLQEQSRYYFRIRSHNEKGSSKYTDILNVTTEANQDTTDSNTSILPFMVGAACGVVAFAVVVFIIIFFVRKIRQKRNRDGQSRQSLYEDRIYDENGMEANQAYVSADAIGIEQAGPSNDVYATVDKKKDLGIANEDNTYAVVKQKGNNEIANIGTSAIYATPNKRKTGSKKQGKPAQAKTKGKKKKQLQKDKRKGMDVYENTHELNVYSKVDGDEGVGQDNIYEQTEGDFPPKRNINKDGLLYADLAFNNNNAGQKKLVIHGLENRTDYVDVDFSKHAEPLPDSDEEGNQSQSEK